MTRERRMVRHRKTGLLLRWSPALAGATEWEVVEAPPEPVDPEPVRKRRPRKQPELAPDVEVRGHNYAIEVSSSG
jgi:hypothetical protein